MKRRLLEEEGVRFEEGSNKIRKEFFVESVGTTTATSPVTREESNGRKSKESTPTPGKATSMSNSKYFTKGITEENLKQEILTLLQMRQAGKTC